MSYRTLSLAVIVTLTVCVTANAVDPEKKKDTGKKTAEKKSDRKKANGAERPDHASSKEEAAIRKAVKSYVAAFNKGDAESVAAMWHESGEWISPAGDRVKGRDAIRAEMEAYFADGGGHIEVSAPKIRFLAETVAVEEGQARVTRRGELPSGTTYIAIHVKDKDGWKLESVRETEIPAPPSNFDHLRDLDWLVGRWVDRDENATIETKCQWTKNRNFLTRSFSVSIGDTTELEGTQVVGWDPSQQKIRSWLFDSSGGFGEGVWTRDGDRWTIRTSQIMNDGARASSINIITMVDDNTIRWQSIGREVDGELQPDVGPVTVVRASE